MALVKLSEIKVGKSYTRPELARIWGYSGWQAIARGIVTPSKTNFIILFITKEKQEHLTQYKDDFEDGILTIEGETSHQSDSRILKSEDLNDEIHLFYRERHHSNFIYHGQVFLIFYQINVNQPSIFKFAVDKYVAQAESSLETESNTHGIFDTSFTPDEEGRRKIVLQIRYERSRKNRAKALEIHGTICLACGFDFNEIYGVGYARDYIEVHHTRSITKQGGVTIDPLTDLIPLCSNCHSMAHRMRGIILSLNKLKSLIQKA
ncbi:hypothetical protein E3V55_03570 [Candidatus Marinimicrobia bacterium MT.SAG.3]|nr:hypothetical protein E3V55_03570 [Candidatus Marinimicrobia bacterium MT.SAG.3]